MPTITKLFSLKEISEHNTREDCWVVIHGKMGIRLVRSPSGALLPNTVPAENLGDKKVYDVTNYLDDHPGGDDVLLTATGRDATEDFEDAGHSKTARELMEEYCIGEVDYPPVIPELDIFRKEQHSNFTTNFISKASEYWVYPATAIGISVVVGTLLYVRKQ